VSHLHLASANRGLQFKSQDQRHTVYTFSTSLSPCRDTLLQPFEGQERLQLRILVCPNVAVVGLVTRSGVDDVGYYTGALALVVGSHEARSTGEAGGLVERSLNWAR
jgi:hypothetical protein